MLKNLRRSSNGDGSIVLSIQIVGQRLRMRSGFVPAFPGEPDRSVDLPQRRPGALHLEDRNPAEFGDGGTDADANEKNEPECFHFGVSVRTENCFRRRRRRCRRRWKNDAGFFRRRQHLRGFQFSYSFFVGIGDFISWPYRFLSLASVLIRSVAKRFDCIL